MEDFSVFSKSGNPWHNKDQFGQMKKRHTLFGALAFCVASLTFPLCANEWISLGILALLSAYVIWLVRTPAPAVGLLLTAALLCILGSSLAPGAVFLALAVGCMSGAFLFTSRRLPTYLVVLIPLLSAGVAFAVTQNLSLSLLSLSLLPAAGLLALATVQDRPRTTVICFCIGGFLLSLTVIVLAVIWKTTGGIGTSSVQGAVEGAKNALVDYFLAQRDAALSLLAGQVTDATTQEAYNQLLSLFSPDVIREVVLEFFNLLPALVAVIFSLAAFFGQMLLLSAYRACGVERVLTLRARTLTVSLTAAIVFAISFLLSMILSGSLAYAVAENLCLILLPIMFLTGFSALLAMTRSSVGARVFMLLILSALFCCYSGGLLYLVALWGAYNRIGAALHKKLQEKNGQTPKDDDSV